MDAATSSISERLISHVAQIAGVDPAALSIETPLHEIGLDSILLAIILRSVEVEFEIEFGDEDIAAFLGASSMSDYLDILRRALSRETSA